MAQVKKRSIARSFGLALCCSLVVSPVWAKTFIGVLYPLFGPMAAIGLVELAGELKAMPDVEVCIRESPAGPERRVVVPDFRGGPDQPITIGSDRGSLNGVQLWVLPCASVAVTL